MIPDDYFCTGQISIFDILAEEDNSLIASTIPKPEEELALSHN